MSFDTDRFARKDFSQLASWPESKRPLWYCCATSLLIDQEAALLIDDVNEKLLDEIAHALSKIAAGSYGLEYPDH